MHLRIFTVGNSFHVHNVTCECEPEAHEPDRAEGEAFASQSAVFLHLWGSEILARQVQADGLYKHLGIPKAVVSMSDITDLWYHTIFMPCTEGLPNISREEINILIK